MGKKTVAVQEIFNKAVEAAKKEGEHKFKFSTNDVKYTFKIIANAGKNAKGEKTIRRKMFINEFPVSAQIARLLLSSVAMQNGEEIVGRKVSRTKPAVAALKAWEQKYGVITNEFNEKASNDDAFTKDELKTLVGKKTVKKALKSKFSKSEIKEILTAFGTKKEIKLKKLLNNLRKQGTLTTEEEKEMFL